MKKERSHTASIFLGSLLAAAIVFSQYLTPECLFSAKKVNTEQTEKTSDDSKTAFISLPTFSIPAPLSVQVNLIPHCLFEFFFQENIDDNYATDDESYTDRFFQTMFRVIISPNAP